MGRDAIVSGNRAEGGRGNAAVNPSAILLSIDNDIRRLESRGFDCSSPEARCVTGRVRLLARGGHGVGSAHLPTFSIQERDLLIS